MVKRCARFGREPATIRRDSPAFAADIFRTGRSVALLRTQAKAVFTGSFFSTTCVRISRSYGMAAYSCKEILPCLCRITSASRQSNAHSTSEKPKREYKEPPSVAVFRNCTPTISFSASVNSDPNASCRPSWVSSARKEVIAPIVKLSSSSSIISRCKSHKSIATGIVRSCIRSHSIPAII